MKTNKRLTMLLMAALVMTGVSGHPMNVSAAEWTVTNGTASFGNGPASILIQPNQISQTLVGKQFKLYKLFDAANSAGNESINYTWNETYKAALQNVVAKALNKAAVDVTEYEAIDYIQSLNHNIVTGALTEQMTEGRYSDFRYFVEDLRSQIVSLGSAGDTVTVESTQTDGSFVITGLDYGYYIIDEVTEVTGTHAAASLCMVTTANPKSQITVKSDYPSVTKKIYEDDGDIGWNDIADYEIGQTVPYRFTSYVQDMNGYHTYYYAWHDIMDDALTFNPDSVVITIADNQTTYTLKDSEYEVTENVTVDGTNETFVVEINDLKAIVDREFNRINSIGHNAYGQLVTLTYEATLNDLAAKDTGRPGFENDVRLEFSNDADVNGSGKTGYTPWDSVVCFTYKLNVLKTNDAELPLSDAKFRLYSDKDCKNEIYVKKTDNGYHIINRDSLGGTDHTGGDAPEEAVEMVSDAEGCMTIYGLDAGTYYLLETEAPVGYRPILDPIRIEVTASFTDDRDTYLKGSGAGDTVLQDMSFKVQIDSFLNGISKTDSLDLEVSIDDGAGNLTVVNTVGSKLPTTGSSGTILMLLAGGGFILLALYFGRKKASDEA